VISDDHATLLTAAAIDLDVARGAGVCSASRADELPAQLHWVARHDGALPGLLFPWRGLDGREVVQYRPDTPITLTGSGETLRYVWPTGAELVVWVHPSMVDRAEPSEFVVIEGTKQYLAGVSAAGPERYVVGISGCRGWMADAVPLPELGRLPVAGRRAVLIFDADLSANRAVWNSADDLGRHLEMLGAEDVAYVRLAAGRKAGLDDYLAVVTDDQRAEVFDRLLATAGKIGRPPARDRRNGNNNVESTSVISVVDSFEDVPEEPGWAVLGDVADVLGRFVIFANDHQRHAVALWIAHTWLFDRLDLTPRLAILSPLKRCGKTRVLTLVRLLSRRGLATVSMSAAYFYRRVEASHPTLVVDEADAIFGRNGRGDELEAPLRGLLNAGYERGATAGRVVGEGANQQPVEFDIFTPAAYAGVGNFLPDAQLDRSVIVQLRRRRRGETVDKLRQRTALAITQPLARRLAAWADRNLEAFTAIDPTIPDGIEDRAADVWESLLVVAEIAGGQWPERARDACQDLNRVRAGLDDAAGMQLLRDLRDIFTGLERDRAFSVELVEKLNALEESPWATWRQGTGFRTQDLARMLAEFEIRPCLVRVGEVVKRGYHLLERVERGRRIAGLADVFGRYLDDNDGTTDGEADAADAADTAPSPAQGVTPSQGVTPQVAATTRGVTPSTGVTPLRGDGAVSERRDGQRRRLVFDVDGTEVTE
jgi:hypothetical protein